jgi:hypothetical protein
MLTSCLEWLSKQSHLIVTAVIYPQSWVLKNRKEYFALLKPANLALFCHSVNKLQSGNAKDNGREPKICFGRVFSSKFGSYQLISCSRGERSAGELKTQQAKSHLVSKKEKRKYFKKMKSFVPFC